MANPQKSKKNRIYTRDGGFCHYCSVKCHPFGNESTHKHRATLDHVQTRMTGGGNADENLVLACFRCNNTRSCVPYDIFVHKELWRPENRHKALMFARLFAIGAQPVTEKQVYILEMYYDAENISVQNWGVFESAQAVHKYMLEKFPTAILNLDDEPGYIGYHFGEDDVLADVSFVANCWDVAQ